MRILHTSDWHLGATLGGHARDDDHRLFLAWLTDTMRDERVDVLVIAGDVFDHAQPSAEAQAMYYRFLASLSQAGPDGARHPRQVVVIGGNHDSASRLDAPREVLGALDVAVVGGYEKAREDALLVPVRRGGDIVGVIAAFPYINEYRLGVTVRAENAAAATAEAFADLHRRVADRAEAMYPGVPLVATGHLTCSPRAALGAEGDAESVIREDDFPQPIHSVGTLGALPPSVFDTRFRYVALGHIHRAFPPEPPRVWYSGTPIPVGFTEADTRRVLLVEVADATDGVARVKPMAVPEFRKLVRLQGTPDEVLARLGAGFGVWPLPPLVDMTVQVPHYDPNLRQRLKEVLEGVHARGEMVPLVAAFRQQARAAAPRGLGEVPVAVEHLTPYDIFRQAWLDSHHEEPPDAIRAAFMSLASIAETSA